VRPSSGQNTFFKLVRLTCRSPISTVASLRSRGISIFGMAAARRPRTRETVAG
jgi:hypothetical protein